MPIVPVNQATFGQGEIGPYMVGRADLPLYEKSAVTLENVIVLPHGGLMFRPGFEFVYDLDITDAQSQQARMAIFDFNKLQQYTLVFLDEELLIFSDKSLVATVTSPYAIEDVRNLRTAQSGDTMVIVHEDYAPRKLERIGSDTAWRISTIAFDNLPFYNYNNIQSITPSATTGSITLTLSSGDGYWKAGHAGVQVKLNSGDATIAAATTALFAQNATGGTAYAGTGTAANAFDANAGTICSAGVNGWIGYDFGSDTTVRVVSIRANTTATYTLAIETDDNSSFTSATTVTTVSHSAVSGTWSHFNIPIHEGEQFFRIRETDGQDLDIQDLVFSVGLVVNATVGTTLSGTGADNAWTEQGWSNAVGYPRTVSFLGNRLVFVGTRDAPATGFTSKDSDVFNFDDTATTDAFGFSFTLSTDRSHSVRDLKVQRNLLIYTSDGQFELDPGSNPLTPTTASVTTQANRGVSTVPLVEIDGEIFHISANQKEFISSAYSFGQDRYVSAKRTTLAHHLFDTDKYPVSIGYLRSYKDTQSNLAFVVREDGEIAVLTVDTDQEVQAWSRFTTDGNFRYAQVTTADHGDGAIETLFTIVSRDTGVYLECLTEEEVYLDHWYTGTDTAKTTWSGLTTLEGETISVVGDDVDQGNYTVSSGSITLTNAAATIYAGLDYTGTVVTHDFVNFLNNIIRGRQITKKRVIVELYNSKTLTIDTYRVPFRSLGDGLLDEPIAAFTGQKEVRVKGSPGRDQYITLTMNEPFPCTIVGVTTEVLLGG